jgi:medium-chain acyl-[acyl-carrier-protein] hydrolase
MWTKSIVEGSSPERRILCVPWAGAGPEAFFAWRAVLPADVSLSVVHLPGRSTRYSEPLSSSIPEIVERIAEALLAGPAPPALLFGHSYGAMLAFEICRRLERDGRAPRRLVVSGSSAPPVVVHEEKVAHLPTDEFLAKVGVYGGLEPELLANQHLLSIFVPILKADFAALESYTFDDPRPVACPIIVLSGRADPLVTRAGLDAWHQVAGSHCEVRLFEGGHFYFQGQERRVLDAILG